MININLDLDTLKELVKDESFLLLVIMLVMIIIQLFFKARSIVNFIDERRRSKVINISNALECKYIEGLTKEHLKHEAINEHFYLSTGISAEKELREAILNAHRDTKGKLSFIHYKKALKYLRCKDDLTLEVKSKPLDKSANVLLTIYSAVVGVIGFFLLFVPPVYSISYDVFTMQYLVISGIGLFFMFFAFLAFYQTFSFNSAMRIKTELEKQEGRIGMVES